MKTDSIWIKKNLYFLIGFIIIISLYLPFFIFGENSYLGSPADYLDSNAVWLKILSESGLSFAPNNTPLPNIENQFRVSYGNELDFIYLLFKIFTPYYALVINSLIISLTAFISLSVLAKNITPQINKILLLIISLTFALLNHWQFGGISIVGSPIIILVCILLVQKQKVPLSFYIFSLFFLLYSSFIIYGMFLIFLILVCAAYLFIKTRKINFNLIIYIAIITVGYLLINYRFITETLSPSFVSNRPSGLPAEIALMRDWKILLERFVDGHGSHAVSRQHGILIIFIIYCLSAFFIKFKHLKKVLLIFGLIVFFVLFSYINFNLLPGVIKALHLDFIYGLTLYRFFFYNGVLWYIILIFITEDFGNTAYRKTVIPLLILGLTVNFYTVLRINTPYQNIRHSFREYYYSFKDYYMISEFKEIDKILPENKSDYRVISYGFDPAASQYNGYFTADGYLNFYEGNQKKKFGKLIVPLLEDNKVLKEKHNSWMHQNFVFTDNFTVGEQVLQKYSKERRSLPVDENGLRALHVNYVLSSIPLNNFYLKEIKSIESKHWSKIYIYQVLNSNH